MRSGEPQAIILSKRRDRVKRRSDTMASLPGRPIPVVRVRCPSCRSMADVKDWFCGWCGTHLAS